MGYETALAPKAELAERVCHITPVTETFLFVRFLILWTVAGVEHHGLRCVCRHSSLSSEEISSLLSDPRSDACHDIRRRHDVASILLFLFDILLLRSPAQHEGAIASSVERSVESAFQRCA